MPHLHRSTPRFGVAASGFAYCMLVCGAILAADAPAATQLHAILLPATLTGDIGSNVRF